MNSTGAFKQQHFFSTTGAGPTDYINTITTTSAIPATGEYMSNGGTMVIGSLPLPNTFSTGFVFTTSNNGTITNQLFVNGTGVSYKNLSFGDIVLDSSNNGYIVGVGYQDTTSDNAVIFKVDSSLNISWQKTLRSAQSEQFNCIAIAGSNLYVGGQYYTGTVFAPILASYDTGGNLLFQKTFSNCTSISSITTDSSNNYYAVANESLTGNIDGIQLTKWDSTDTFQWGKRIYGASDFTSGSAVNIDSSGNIFVLMRVLTYSYLLKFNSSGTIQWQKRIDVQLDSINGMTIDNSGNVYLSLNPTSILNTSYIIKISTSGTIVWQNQMVVSPNFWSTGRYAGIVWKFNHLLIRMAKSGNPSFVFSLPDNGTKTGTYAPYLTYSTSNVTISTSSLTIATQLNTSSSLSLTSATTTFPSSAGNITQSVTQI